MIAVEYHGIDFTIPDFGEITADDIEIKHESEVFESMYMGIEVLVQEPEWKVVPCFMANDVVFEMHRESVDEYIENCINYYSKIEEYERCSKLTNFKNKI